MTSFQSRELPEGAPVAPGGGRARRRGISALAAAVRTITASRSWALHLYWYFALLLIAVVWKYLATQWGDVLEVPARAGHGVAAFAVRAGETAPRLLDVYRADVLEALALLVALSLVGRLAGRRRLPIVAWASLSGGAIVAFAEWLSVRETGIPLTHANLMISVHWGMEHPEVIPAVFPWTGIALVLAGCVAYGALPVIASAAWVRRRVPRPVLHASSLLLTLAAVALIAPALAGGGRAMPRWTQNLSATDGFWSSSVASLVALDAANPLNLPRESRDTLLARYRRVAFPLGRPATPETISLQLGRQDPRHVVLLVLETAPRRYYRLADDTSLHTFHAMAASAIVAAHHVTTRPYTQAAIFSLLTGTYPRPGPPIGAYGPFRTDGLATTLDARGYESTYIDSWVVDWGYHERAELVQQGFTTMLDSVGFHPPAGASPFAAAVARERFSLDNALGAITRARSDGKKAFVVVATTLGHFPWRAPPALAGEPGTAKLHAIALQLDRLVGGFLHSLDSLHLRDSTIIVVVGDHGLRYAAEFESLGFTGRPGDVDFHVPCLIYAPGLIPHRLDIPYATSHIDVAPTLFALLGIPTDSLLLDGHSMLDARLRDRATFLMNTGIYPVDGFLLQGRRFRWNTITNAASVTPPLWPGEQPQLEWSPQRTRRLLTDAKAVFNETAAYFLEREAGYRGR